MKVLDQLWNHWEKHADAGQPILCFTKAHDSDLPFGLPRIEKHPQHQKCTYIETTESEDEADIEDELDVVAGKCKATDALEIGAGGSSSVRKPVTVEGAPISSSPFSLVDCMLLSHFFFNDFITVAFPDLAGDLDTQI